MAQANKIANRTDGDRRTSQTNQNLQNTANQRSEELKTSNRVTGAGETSNVASANTTNVDGRVSADDRDIETFDATIRNSGARTGDDRDTRNH